MSCVLCFVAIFFLVSHLQMVIAGVWITSALYSIPKFIFSRTITNIHLNGIAEEICIMDRAMFNSKLLDSINLSALYLLPLLVMTVSDSNECVICVWSKSWKFHKKTTERTNERMNAYFVQYSGSKNNTAQQFLTRKKWILITSKCDWRQMHGETVWIHSAARVPQIGFWVYFCRQTRSKWN